MRHGSRVSNTSKGGRPVAKTVALLGALDTKGTEYAFVKRCIEARGHKTLLIDVGVLGPPAVEPDVSREEVARAAGADAAALAQKADRGEAVAAMSRGAATLMPMLYAEGKLDAVMALGGGGGTSVACAAMRTLPLGVPKVMVSTVAGTDVSGYVGVKDIVMIPSIVDISGVNRISRPVFATAAGAICGMLEADAPPGEDRPLVAASMFGNTTACVEAAKAILEEAGYEVLVFHATGTGGRTMESLVEAGLISGVLDVTTTEWADELVGGVLAAGPTRLEAAARAGVPAIVAPGCLDMVNFWAPETVPEKFKGRKFYPHNPNITLMRTTPDECRRLGRVLAEKLNQSTGPVSVLLPLRGLSMIDAEGGPFWWPEANRALFDALRQNLRDDIPVVEIDGNINDAEFSRRCAETLLKMLRVASA
ncbi:MAG: Tm-1-like ATP-binding domain-containing protein [Pirellulales bacterium]|nr:Tm-1-like ATP-binding domain-containing protein [Pirellulales bacterium]